MDGEQPHAEAVAPVSAPSGARARVALIGGFRLTADGRDAPVGGVRAQALLAALALAPPGGVARGTAAALVWSDAPPDRARASLRQGLRALRRALEAAGLDGVLDAGPALALDPRRCDADVREVVSAAEAGAAHAALLGDADPFSALFGLDGCAGEAFADFMAAEAEALRRAVRRALAEAAPGPAAERDRAHACALLDPADEGAARRAMTAHAALGETHRALGVYDRLWRTLDQRFGAEPGEETQALLARLRQGATPARRAAPTADAAPTFWLPPCVADAAPGAQSTAAGLRLELAAAAARLAGWTVRLGDGAFGVRARVGVGRAGEGFAFLLTLEEADTARVFWATRENATPAGAARAARGAHAAFARITGSVASSVGGGALALLAARSAAATPDLGDRDAPASSASLLAGALDGAPPTLGMVEQALAEAHAAVDAEPLSAPSRRALGWAQLFARAFAQAAECFALAAELDPTDAEALREAALGLALCGEANAARTVLADAAAIEPDEEDAFVALAAVALGDPAPPTVTGPILVKAWCAPGACGALDAARARRLARALPMADEARAATIEAALLAAASHTA